MTILTFTLRLSQLTSLLPLAYGLSIRQGLAQPYRTLLWYVAVCAAMEIISGVAASVFNNTMPLLHIFTVLEYCLLGTVFYLYFRDHSKIQKLLLASGAVFFSVAILDAYQINSFSIFNDVSRPAECIVFVIYALLYFGSSMLSNNNLVLWKQPMFWVSSGVLIFFSLMFFYFVLFNYLPKDNQLIRDRLDLFYYTVNIIPYLAYTKCFQCLKQSLKSQILSS